MRGTKLIIQYSHKEIIRIVQSGMSKYEVLYHDELVVTKPNLSAAFTEARNLMIRTK